MTFSTDLAKLTPAEAHALETHLCYAGDESFAAHGATDTVRDLDQIARTVTSARKNILGTGKPYVKPSTALDVTELAHESLFGALSSAERHALAVHMVHAWEETTHAGYATLDMRSELMAIAYDADYAASATLTPSGLMMGRTARKRASIAIGAPKP